MQNVQAWRMQPVLFSARNGSAHTGAVVCTFSNLNFAHLNSASGADLKALSDVRNLQIYA
jgi:hypothetical protein